MHITAATVVTRSILKPGQYSGLFPFDDNASWEKNAATLQQLYTLARALAGAGEEDMTTPPVLDIHEILKKLPHRYPFLLVDRVLELEHGQAHQGAEERHHQRAVLHRPLPGTGR